ncbi:MAG: heavy-metal-associated domain-containing protein [Candidatus Binatia bacterium]
MRTKTAIISIQDLTSEALPSLREALKAVPGVESVDFSLERSVAVVEFDPKQSNVDNLLHAVLKAGYKLA